MGRSAVVFSTAEGPVRALRVERDNRSKAMQLQCVEVDTVVV
jgi:hypothetical protein